MDFLLHFELVQNIEICSKLLLDKWHHHCLDAFDTNSSKTHENDILARRMKTWTHLKTEDSEDLSTSITK